MERGGEPVVDGQWHCLLCGVHLIGHRQRAAHMRNYGLGSNDYRRCDNVIRIPIGPDMENTNDDNVIRIPVVTNTFADDPRCAQLLTRRRRADDDGPNNYTEVDYNHPVIYARAEPIDMVVIQAAWTKHLLQTKALACPSFWRFFQALQDQPQVAIDAALQAARSTFLKNASEKERRAFIPSKKELLRRMKRIVPQFWPKVTHSIEIDLARFDINKKLVFRFINPMWAWIVAARRLPQGTLQWRATSQINRATGQRLYGGGMQYGQAMERACSSCPVGTFPMGINCHFDGAHAHGMWTTPITIGVANANGQSALGHVCIGFFPKPDLGRHFSTTVKSTQVKHYIRQRCIAAVLSVLEEGARRGVRCSISSVVRTLYPRLMAMNLDQPEAQAYYGMKNGTSCSKCRFVLMTLSVFFLELVFLILDGTRCVRRRKGRSAHRRATSQSGLTVNTLYNIVENDTATEEMRLLASEKLSRWGFNPKRRCLLTTVAKHLLVRTRSEPDEVFPCLDWRDKLHGLFSFLFRIFDKIFDNLHLSSNTKQILESRLLQVCLAGDLRDPISNHAYRVQRNLFDGKNLTTYDKVCIFFLLPHVIGHRCTILPERQRFHILSALTLAQKLIIAVRGRRSYSVQELNQIFDTDYIALFTHLESLHEVNSDKRHRKRMRRHMQNPQKYKAPTRFVPKDRLKLVV